MKKYYALVLVALAVAGGFWLMQSEDQVAEYNLRENLVKQSGDMMPYDYWVKLVGNNETGIIEPEDHRRAEAAINKRFGSVNAEKSATLEWVEMGPDNIGGRTRSILIVDENTIFTGGVSGGLWKSVNAGNNWTRVSSCPAMMVSTIAMTGNGDLYVGTGSSFDNGGGEGASGFPGTGVYRSADGGANWSLVPGTGLDNFDEDDVWSYINGLQGDPNKDDRVWIGSIGGLGYYDSQTNELYHPGNGDEELTGLPNNDRCFDLQISGSMYLVNIEHELFRSTNGGNSWTKLADDNGNGEPNEDVEINSSGRLTIAISPDNTNVMYALKANGGGALRDAYYSEDGGDTWTDIWPNTPEYDLFGGNTQGGYDNCVSVVPGSPGLAIFGGVTLWRAGGDQQPEMIAANFAPPQSQIYVHSDIHTFEWSPAGVLYIGTDGGIFKSFDQGTTFLASNKGYNVTQFYGMAFAPFGGAMAGAQDNGTVFIPNDGSLPSDQQGIEVGGGDGFDCEISQVTHGGSVAVIACSQNGNIFRGQEDGGGGSFYDDEIMQLQEDNDFEIGSFYTTFFLHEDTEDYDSQRSVIFINPFGKDTTFTQDYEIELLTENLTLPFNYTFVAGSTLQYWDTLVRPELVLEEFNDYVNPHFWLDPQDWFSTIVCDTVSQDSVGFDIEYIITPIDTCEFIADSLICITIGYDTTEMFITEYEYLVECDTTQFTFLQDTTLNAPQHFEITDPYTTIFAAGFTAGQGLWITREALDFNTTPDWWKLVDVVSGNASVKEIEIAQTGKELWYSTWNNRLLRVSNLDEVWDAGSVSNAQHDIVISSTGGVVAGMHIDSNNPDHMVIGVAGYSSGAGVRETWNATAATPIWEEIWNPGGELNNIPIFDVMVESTDSDGSTILAATEWGVFMTTDGGANWEECNGGAMERVPAFDVRQQNIGIKPYMHPTNSGSIYVGTHGRGIFRTDEFFFVGVEEFDDKVEVQNGFNLYPNPASADVNLEFDLTESTDVFVQVYSIQGQLVKEIPSRRMGVGSQRLVLDASDLDNGNYVVAIVAGDHYMTQKMVVYK